MITASPSPAKTPAPTATPKPTATPVAKKTEEFKPVIATEQLAESPSYPPQVRKIVDFGLYLASRHLSYKYTSADPAKGGMDCSGFIHYVLIQSGIADAPRDAREQYSWVRKAGNFKVVLAQRDDTFELDELQPGDLLFWASNFGVSRDPEIMQTMIYIGRDKTTNARLMIGASEHGMFNGQIKSGVSVFDFKVGRASTKSGKETSARVCRLRPYSGLLRETKSSLIIRFRFRLSKATKLVTLPVSTELDPDCFCNRCFANANATNAATIAMTMRCSRFVSSKMLRIRSRIESDL